MKKVYLVHGWKGPPLGGWFNWVKEELEKKGFEVIKIEMPEKNKPHLETWVSHLQKVIPEVHSNTFFVGHSVGCQTILRFLDRLPAHSRVGGCVFVAGWFELKSEHYKIKHDEEEKRRVKEWLEHPMNLAKIRMHTKNVLAIFSDNDHFVPTTNIKLFEEKLHAKTILKHNEEHLNHTKKIPEIVEYLKTISEKH